MSKSRSINVDVVGEKRRYHNITMTGYYMNEQKPAPVWISGAGIGTGVGVGSAIGRGAGDTFVMKLIIGAAVAIVIGLAAHLILTKLFTHPRG